MSQPIQNLAERPPRVTIRRLDNPDLILEAQYNPSELEETIGAAYAKLVVPGLSHKVKQFTNTEDDVLKFKLDYVVDDGGPAAADRLIAARLFFKTSVRPRRNIGAVSSGGAPRLLFFWPNFMSMTSILVAASLKYTQFNSTGRPIRMSVDVTLEDVRDTIILADDFFDEAP